MPGYTSSFSPLFLILFFLISLFLSIYFYRNSAINNVKKYFLIGIKTAAIFLLLSLFIDPILSFISNVNAGNKNIILTDLSRSNLIDNKKSDIKSICSNIFNENNNENVFIGFTNNSEFIRINDSLSFNGYTTNLTSSLKQLQEIINLNNLDKLILITDGIVTEGGNPLYEAKKLNIPMIIIPIGDSLKKKDISVKEVISNSIAIAGSNVEVKALINSYQTGEKVINVKLFREGTVIKSSALSLNPERENYEIIFNIKESEAGKYKYKIETENIPDEATYLNNYEDFFITFTDNKINILAISGGPSYDNEFLGSIIKRAGNYNITFKTLKSKTEFYDGAINKNIYKELSNIIFINFPNTNTDFNLFKDIADNIKQNNLPILFFAGKNTDFQKLNLLEDIIPFSVSGLNSSENITKLSIVQGIENPLEKISGINNMPEIFINLTGVIPKPGSVTFAISQNQSIPVVIFRNTGKSLSAAFLGYGLWKWKLNKNVNLEKNTEQMFLELLNITLQKEKPARLKVYPEKDIFDYTEKATIYAEVYDENYAITKNAIINGIIKEKNSGKIIEEIKFYPFENKYKSVLEPLKIGDYTIECNAELTGDNIPKAYNRFLVDTLNTEFKELSTNYILLQELASLNGGKIISKDSINKINEIIKNFSVKNDKDNAKTQVYYELNKNKYFFFLIILIFTLEWIIRKRSNLA